MAGDFTLVVELRDESQGQSSLSEPLLKESSKADWQMRSKELRPSVHKSTPASIFVFQVRMHEVLYIPILFYDITSVSTNRLPTDQNNRSQPHLSPRRT